VVISDLPDLRRRLVSAPSASDQPTLAAQGNAKV
jgi:hypothetical protein